MTTYKTLLILLTFLCCHNLYSQKGKSTIYFEDGTSKTWHINNILQYKKDIKFKKPVKRIKLKDEKSNELIIYEYLELKKKKKRFLGRIIYQGKKVTLYSRYILHNRSDEYSPYDNNGASEVNPMGDIHYAKKTNKDFCEEISLEGANAIYGNTFKRKAIKFFSDCPELVSKIKRNEIKNSNKIEAFKFYDNECQ